MSNRFFDRPILNSPYEYPSRHCELDESGQPTSHILDSHRRVAVDSGLRTVARDTGDGPAPQALAAQPRSLTYTSIRIATVWSTSRVFVEPICEDSRSRASIGKLTARSRCWQR